MNELQRLHYLDALDIPQWVSKAPLPFAKESEFVELSPLLSAHSANEQVVEKSPETVTENANEKNLQSDASHLPNSSQTAPANPVYAQHQEPTLAAAPTIDTPIQISAQTSQDTSANVTSPSLDKPTAGTAGRASVDRASVDSASIVSSPAFTCAIQMQGKRGQFLILAELRNELGKISAQEQTLLNNISRAIDNLYSNNSTTPILPEQFKWPLFESHFNAQHIDQSEQAAKESAGAFLHSKLKRYHVEHVLILGEQAEKLFFEHIDKDAEQQGHHKFSNIHFIVGTSLKHLLGENSGKQKAELWRKLLNSFKQTHAKPSDSKTTKSEL